MGLLYAMESLEQVLSVAFARIFHPSGEQITFEVAPVSLRNTRGAFFQT